MKEVIVMKKRVIGYICHHCYAEWKNTKEVDVEELPCDDNKLRYMLKCPKWLF